MIKQKALKGDGEAMYQYSEYLIKENLVGYELKESHKWHSKAAKAGYSKVLANEAWFIIRGWVKEPLEQAFKYFYQAAEQNDKEGFFGLGECYSYGWGVEKDFEKARCNYCFKSCLQMGFSWGFASGEISQNVFSYIT